MFIFPVQLTTSRIGNLTRLIHTLLYVMTIHTYIYVSSSCYKYGMKYEIKNGICGGLQLPRRRIDGRLLQGADYGWVDQA